jgi:predicted NBD/HSP70 family sugar kinase
MKDYYERTALAVDIGGTKILTAVINRRGEILSRYQCATPSYESVRFARAGLGENSVVTGAAVCAIGKLEKAGNR